MIKNGSLKNVVPATPMVALSDDDVLALADLQLEHEADRRLSALLESQQAGTLSSAERSELLTLMQLYQDGLLRKAGALKEAVRRGLRLTHRVPGTEQ